MNFFKSFFSRVMRVLKPRKIVYASISVKSDSNLLSDKVVLVTGGGSGFGLAIAKRFVSAGARVIITGRNEKKLCYAMNEIGKDKCRYVVWDLCDISILKSKYAEASNIFGPIDIAINNAGVWASNPWNLVDESEWNLIIDTNLKGLFFMCQVEAEHMSKDTTKMNKIINITSIEGIRAGFAPYSASKWGANGITKGLAKLLAGKNIIVNAIAPGMGITDINPNLPKDGNLALDNLNGRFVAVEEIAELALFLASDASNSIVGQVIVVDGGMSLN